MAQYRIDTLAALARQMGFTPADVRAEQLSAAEQLLHEIDPARAYPLSFVIFRITAFQPPTRVEAELLTGLALQHDLGLLIELVSATLRLHVRDVSEPVLSIDDVTERFNVTSKTIQRWRRKGLPARRFTFLDGRQRVGFLLSSVEQYIARHQEEVPAGTHLGQVQEPECQAMIRHARRLVKSGCWPDEIARRVGRKLGRSPLAVLHTLRKHDAEHPNCAVLTAAVEPPSDADRQRVRRKLKRGWSLRRLGRRLGRPRASVGRILLEARVAKLTVRKIKFYDDVLYHDADAERLVRDLVCQPELGLAEAIDAARLPRDLPPYLRDLYREPLLSASRERALFLKFNFHKFQFASLRRKLDPASARSRDLAQLESHLRLATDTKNLILRANLRLVVSVARKHVRPAAPLMELVSDGNLTLMRAVESFDTHRGYRFSTYATLALMKGFARSVPAMLAAHSRGTGPAPLADLADTRHPRTLQRHLDREHLDQLMLRLTAPERAALLDEYGLHPGEPRATSGELRHLRDTAIAKLRSNA